MKDCFLLQYFSVCRGLACILLHVTHSQLEPRVRKAQTKWQSQMAVNLPYSRPVTPGSPRLVHGPHCEERWLRKSPSIPSKDPARERALCGGEDGGVK